MKNEKTLSGIAYMFLGGALLVSGASVQEQFSRLAYGPDVQLAKAMYISVLNKAVSGAKTEVLAVAQPPAVMEVDSAEVPVVPKAQRAEASIPAPRRVFEVRVAVPQINIADFANLPRTDMFQRLPQAELQKIQASLEKANFQAMAAANRSAELKQLLMLRADLTKAQKCTKALEKTEL
ncbi:MAG TPA: hypothetical protein VMZ25_11315 [Terriglobales bacterium]|nr:hypothetical protein [Terriglobales bacterium]